MKGELTMTSRKVIPLRAQQQPDLATLSHEFLTSKARELGRESKTVLAYRRDLTRFTAAFEGVLPADVSTAAIETYLAGLTVQGHGAGSEPRPVAPATMNRHLATLTGFFGWLEAREAIARSPLGGGRVKKAKLPRRPPAALDDVMREELVAAAKAHEPRLHLLVALMLASGLRIAEALALDVGDLDLADRRVQVRAGKGDKARVAYFGPEEAAIAKAYLKKHHRQPQRADAPLFESSRGNRLSYSRAYSLLQAIATDLVNADGSKLHWHQTRHDYATRQMRKGINPAMLMAILGHDDARVFNRYVEAAKQEAAEREYRRVNR
jgi:site-specific recombinase XerD